MKRASKTSDLFKRPWTFIRGVPDMKFLSYETMSAAWKHLHDAEAAAAGDPEFARRVQVAQ